MRVLLFFILSMIYFVQSDLPPSVICGYQGAYFNGKFILEDVPERCEAVCYGGNYFNVEPPKADKDAITALKNAGKPVYMMYMYENSDKGRNLVELANPNNIQKLDQYMAPMISYLKDNKIDGVIFGFLDMAKGVQDYDTKICEFFCKIKGLVPSIKVGLYVLGNQFDKWNNKDIFDFSVTNTILDFYMIDLSVIGIGCYTYTSSTGGRYPITSDNQSVASLDKICSGVSGSGMDKTKVTVNIAVITIRVDASGSATYKTYSDYCRRDPKELWCGDTMQLMYNEGVFLKTFFKAMMLSDLDTDDMDNVCKCGKYPVTNTFIDAWEKKPITCCDAIS